MTDLPKLSNLFSSSHVYNYSCVAIRILAYITYVLFYKAHCLQLYLPRQCHFSYGLFRLKQPNDNLITLPYVFVIYIVAVYVHIVWVTISTWSQLSISSCSYQLYYSIICGLVIILQILLCLAVPFL